MLAEQHGQKDSSPIIVLAQASLATNIIYQRLKTHFNVTRLILERPVARHQFINRRLKQLGPLKVLGQIIFRSAFVPLLNMKSKARISKIISDYQLNIAEPDQSLITRVDTVNSSDTIELIKQLSPKLVVLNGTRILSKHTLSQIACPIINMHCGITPSFRGVHGAYWALAQGRADKCGVTVHLVDCGIDTGAILGQTNIEPEVDDNFVTYPYLQVAQGLPLLINSIRAILDDKIVKFSADADKSKLWSHPTAWEYLVNYLRSGVK